MATESGLYPVIVAPVARLVQETRLDPKASGSGRPSARLQVLPPFSEQLWTMKLRFETLTTAKRPV